MSDLFTSELQDLLELERTLLNETLPHLRGRARAESVRSALDRHLLETETHVANLERVLALADGATALEVDGELDALATILRTEALEAASYAFVVHVAEALGVDEEYVRLLRLNMEQDEVAGEHAEAALVELLAEKVENAERV